MSKVAVMGSGSWGTAFAAMCQDAGEETLLWSRRADCADQINRDHRNGDYLADIDLPPQLRATADAEEALTGADVVVLAVPSVGVQEQLQVWGDLIDGRATLVSLIKGVDVETRRFGSQIIAATLDCQPDRVVVVSGPNLARECALRLPAATVAASPHEQRARRVQQAVMTPYFRVYTNPDKIGVEIAGAVKNVIALAAGMAEGMGFGDNTKATVITRGLAEMQRLGVAFGGQPQTFAGLAGIGDLVATCTSPQSRNRTVGEKLGRGMALADVVAQTHQVAEGVRSSTAILALAVEAGVDMPITEHVVKVVHEGMKPSDMVRSLMTREAKSELHGLDEGATAAG